MASQNKEQPMQPIYIDQYGTKRFRQNEIVRYILDHGGIDLNHIAMQGNRFTDEDRRQFAQLIGYSVSGYGDLSYVSEEACAAADAAALSVTAKPKEGGERGG